MVAATDDRGEALDGLTGQGECDAVDDTGSRYDERAGLRQTGIRLDRQNGSADQSGPELPEALGPEVAGLGATTVPSSIGRVKATAAGAMNLRRRDDGAWRESMTAPPG